MFNEDFINELPDMIPTALREIKKKFLEVDQENVKAQGQKSLFEKKHI